MRDRLTRDDEGAVAVMVAVLAVVLVGMTAFAADLGQAYAARRRLSTAADGAALAAAYELAVADESCASVSPSGLARARDVADDYSSNRNASGSAIESFQVDCDGAGRGRVAVDNVVEVDFVFGGLFDRGETTVHGAATAIYGVPTSVVGLRPYGLCVAAADVAALRASASVPSSARPTFRLSVDNLGPSSPGACGTASGNWGVLDFDGGSNTVNETEEWTEHGYDGEVDSTGTPIFDGRPGVQQPGALEAEMNAILGTPIALPLYDQVAGSGQNAKFRVVQFIGVKLCGWKFGNKNGSSSCSIQPLDLGASAPDYLDLRFERIVTVGELGSCAIGAACDSGLRALELTR